MHQLIATYLFQHKQCTLLKYGHLFIKTSSAESNFINKVHALKLDYLFLIDLS